MGAIDDVVSTMKGGVENIGQLVQVIQNVLPRINGSFTLSAATTTVVTQPEIASNSMVFFTAINATAALTQRTAGLFHSANTAGTSFSISTQSGTAIGTERFEYSVINPV